MRRVLSSRLVYHFCATMDPDALAHLVLNVFALLWVGGWYG
jgi:hypothetical protein